jgi:hypothetical protein
MGCCRSLWKNAFFVPVNQLLQDLLNQLSVLSSDDLTLQNVSVQRRQGNLKPLHICHKSLFYVRMLIVTDGRWFQNFLFFYCHCTVHDYWESSQGIVMNAHRCLYTVVMLIQPGKKTTSPW